MDQLFQVAEIVVHRPLKKGFPQKGQQQEGENFRVAPPKEAPGLGPLKIIAEAFRDQAQQVGLDVAGMELVIHTKHYTADELAMFRYPLPRRQKTKLRQWLDEEGGIGGEAFGLEVESMPLDRLQGLVDGLIERLL